jgi:3-phytase/alkaline phosphatase D
MTESTITKFATFNANDLRTGEVQGSDSHAKAAAEAIQWMNPDVLCLNEIAYDVPGVDDATTEGQNAQAFVDNYLKVHQQPGLPILDYPYIFFSPVNSGDGEFEGQYGMALFSKYPIDYENARTSRNFLWGDMPDNRAPHGHDNDTLSSKSHWDVPIIINGTTVHVLMAHPISPDCELNISRNHDEIRFFADYIVNEGYIYDDDDVYEGLAPDSKFVIMGDMNADPNEGNGAEAICQLVENPLIDTSVFPSSIGGKEADDGGNPPEYDTVDWDGNLQVDYVLPSTNMEIIGSAVFWPADGEELLDMVEGASDHRLTWVDVELSLLYTMDFTMS